MDAAQYGFTQLSVLFSPCLGSCDIFYFWNARIYKVDVFVYLWRRTESPLGDAHKKLNVGDENKHTLLCIVPLCSHITRTVCWELASCLVRMWTRVWSIPRLARRLADVLSKKKKKGTPALLWICLAWSWLSFCFWCSKWGGACRLPVAVSVLRIFLPAADQRRSAKALVGGCAGITRQFRTANWGQKKTPQEVFHWRSTRLRCRLWLMEVQKQLEEMVQGHRYRVDPLPKSCRRVASMLPPPCRVPSHTMGWTARRGQIDLSAQDGLAENLRGIIGRNGKRFGANTFEQQRRFACPNLLSLLHKRPLRVVYMEDLVCVFVCRIPAKASRGLGGSFTRGL